MKSRQKRVLFFAHDGAGLGHVTRVSKLAEGLQGPAACLVISGHREMSWIVPKDCEYIHLPDLVTLLNKDKFYYVKPFIDFGSREEVYYFRKKLLCDVITSFNPDAIFTDYLPLGKLEELDEIIKNYPAKKYYIARGILDHPDQVKIDILGGKGEEYLEKYYDRIFVTCDRRICDLVREYNLSKILEQKLLYVGYVRGLISQKDINQARLERGVGKDAIWVVCSVGGGKLGKSLIEEHLGLADKYQDIYFDIVLGARSNYQCDFCTTAHRDYGNIRIHRENQNLKYLHAGCDITICTGSYNSLMESLQGNSVIITRPIQVKKTDEQYVHPQRLSNFVNILSATTSSELEEAFKIALEKIKKNTILDKRLELNYNGVEAIKKIVFADLMI